MHIPDNYLSPTTCAVMGMVMIPVWARSIKKVKEEVSARKMPLLGVGASLSFLTMMFNVPLPGGTTGHAVGGTLIAILLGPESATIAITIALLVQALLFGDGGILAFGANCFNMAFVIPFAGYGVYKFIKRFTKNENIAAILGGYIGINVAAFCAAIEFGIQPILFKDAAGVPLYCPYPLKVTIPSMLIPHLAVAGVLEAIITVGVLGFVKKVSPGLIYEETKGNKKPIYILIAILVLLTPLGLIASGTAWGEWGVDEIKKVVANGKSLGYVPKGMINGFHYKALMGDYSISGLPDVVGYVISAIAAVAIFLIIFRLIGSGRKMQDKE